MKKYAVTGLFCLLFISSFAQKLTFEPVLSLRLITSESNLISVGDTVFAFEDNNLTPAKELSIGFKMNYELSRYFSFSGGIEYFRGRASYAIFNDDACELCPVRKAGGTFSYSFALPQQLNLQLYKNRNWRLFGTFGLTPIVNFQDKPPVVTAGRHFSPGVAEVINNLHTTIQPVYLDHHVGIKIKYRRFNGYFTYQDNLYGNSSDPLRVYGSTFAFKRRTKTLVFSLSYDLFRSSEAGG